MESPPPATDLEALSRSEFARLVSLLTNRLGAHALETAEDAVQDAFEAAARHWGAGATPSNPAGWLYQVAWRKAIDQLRRASPAFSLEDVPEIAASGHDRSGDSTGDPELRLMLLCCHPTLPPESQVTLTLRVAAAFSIPEIARLLGVSADAVDQRLLRARRRLRTEADTTEIPEGDLPRRAAVALDVLYALFSEGYSSYTAATGLRKELCSESIRLALLLQRHPTTASVEANALIALFAFQASRLETRFDPAGGFQSLRDQDRSQWDATLVAQGFSALSQSRGRSLSRYHLEAEIAACHAGASDYASTDWNRIVDLYDLLRDAWPSPSIALGRAIALGERDGPAAALEALEADAQSIGDTALFHAAVADAHQRLGDALEARASLRRALDRAIAPRVIRTLEDRLATLTM